MRSSGPRVLYTLVFTTFGARGGLSGSFYTKIMLAQLKEDLARAKAAHEDLWAVTIARYNAVLIRRAKSRVGLSEYPLTPLRDDDLNVDSTSLTVSPLP